MRGRVVAMALTAVLGAAGCASASPVDPEPAALSTTPSATHATPTPGTLPTRTPATPTRPPNPLRLSVLGDVGATTESARVLAAVGARGDDATLVVGDLSYAAPGSEARWCRSVTRALGSTHPIEIVSGNHEDDGPDGSIAAFEACLPNRLPGLVGRYGREWYVDLPAEDPLVRVVMISPALDFGHGPWSYASGTEHYRWTEAALRGARRAGIPWVVAGMHMPCLSVGVYACEPGADLLNLLVRERVDLVVTGHEHMYQRTHRLGLGSACPVVVPGRYDAGCVVASGGTTVVTVGTGGHELRDRNPADPEARYFAAVSARDRDAAFGFLAVDVTDRHLVARFEPAAGSTFTDEVRLTR
ncbi:metallophosphoesterase [Phycicoccus avicenniae]|uniref:metallophosphoesterase n=1 Tax=Phycicoccus avicenniae TaxID=2828860 RepID=UPI003D2C2276